METEISAHTLLHFLLHREMRRTLLQTFTQGPPQSECGEIPTSGFAHTLVQSCHVSHSVAISLRIIVSRKKKSVPELNDQPTYKLMWI